MIPNSNKLIQNYKFNQYKQNILKVQLKPYIKKLKITYNMPKGKTIPKSHHQNQ